MCSKRTLGAAIALATVLTLSATVANAAGKVVFVSFGGTYQAAQESAYAKPFAQQEGVELISDSGPNLAKIKAMVQAKAVQWDVVEVTEADYVNLVQQDLLEPIDYSVFDKDTLAAIDTKFRPKYGVAAVLYAFGIAYRTDLNRPSHPTNWKEFWDTTKFPGPRAMPSGTFPNPPWESALLADGVTPDKLYPIDFKRTLGSLDKIKSSVKVWYNDTAAGVQSLVSGDVDYASLPNGRVIQAKAQGAKVDFEYGQAFLYLDYFVVPKGAPNKAEAMKLLAFASKSEPSAALMKAMPYSPPNANALKLLDPAYAASLPTAPDNIAREIPITGTFYGEDSGNGQTWQEVALKTWNEWYGR
jgi:putative spermidine/putrescine transport system substrate-binding protein